MEMTGMKHVLFVNANDQCMLSWFFPVMLIAFSIAKNLPNEAEIHVKVMNSATITEPLYLHYPVPLRWTTRKHYLAMKIVKIIYAK